MSSGEISPKVFLTVEQNGARRQPGGPSVGELNFRSTGESDLPDPAFEIVDELLSLIRPGGLLHENFFRLPINFYRAVPPERVAFPCGGMIKNRLAGNYPVNGGFRLSHRRKFSDNFPILNDLKNSGFPVFGNKKFFINDLSFSRIVFLPPFTQKDVRLLKFPAGQLFGLFLAMPLGEFPTEDHGVRRNGIVDQSFSSPSYRVFH